MAKSRKVRSDILVGNLEKKLGLEPGAIRNPDGSDARSNKKLETLRKEFSKAKGTNIKTNPTISSKSIAKASKAVRALSGTVVKVEPLTKQTTKKAVKKSPIVKAIAKTKASSPKAIAKTKVVPKTTAKGKTTATKVKKAIVKKG